MIQDKRWLQESLSKPRVILSACLLINLLWLIGYAPWRNEQERLLYHPPNPDTRSYHAVAMTLLNYWDRPDALREILPNRPDVAHAITNRPLGYPLVMALIYAAVGVHPMFILILHLVLNVAGCWLAMRTLALLFDARQAALGGWLYALNPLLLEYGCQVLSEVPFAFLVTLILWVFVRLHRRVEQPNSRLLHAFLLGVMVGLASSVRASMLYLAILLPAYFLFERHAWQRRLLQIGLYGLGVMLIVAPWLIYNRVHYHTWHLTLSGEIHLLHMVAELEGGGKFLTEARRPLFERAFARMRQDGLDPYRHLFERGRYYRAIVREYVLAHPLHVAKRVAAGVAHFWLKAGTSRTGNSWLKERGILAAYFRIYHLLYILLLMVGFLWMIRRREWRWFLGLFVAVALYFTLTAGWAGGARYRLQVFPASLPLIVAGGSQLRQWSARLVPSWQWRRMRV